MSTIYALSTVPGKSAIAVIRISGPKSSLILTSLCGPGSPPLRPRFVSLRTLRHPTTLEPLDRSLTLFMKGPKTFTGEDIAEFHVHGSTAVISAVLAAIPMAHESIRYAAPGEFSKRAFYNGKLDLTQAEGLADLINSQTEQQRKSAFGQVEGSLSRLYADWRNKLIEMRGQLEAIIDFGEDNDGIEDAIHGKVVDSAIQVRDALSRHLTSSLKGELLRAGIQVAIFGPPNAGKSSLLNILAQRDASIVSSEAGTTRDVVETILDVGGFPVIVGDTAGLREGDSVGMVEREGVRRARKRVREANLRICVVPNGSEIDETTSSEIASCLAQENGTESVLLVLNKTDQIDDQSAGSNASRVSASTGIPEAQIFQISCITRQGIDHFLARLVERLKRLTTDDSVDGVGALGTNARHRDQVKQCLSHLSAFIGNTVRSSHESPLTIADDDQKDVVIGAEELRYASDALGRVTGRIDVEEILGKIFSSFCIGK